MVGSRRRGCATQGPRARCHYARMVTATSVAKLVRAWQHKYAVGGNPKLWSVDIFGPHLDGRPRCLASCNPSVRRQLGSALKDMDTEGVTTNNGWDPGHLRTPNPVELTFAALRLRTDAVKRFKRVDRDIAVIWKMLLVAEKHFRRLKAPALMREVYLGLDYADGVRNDPTLEQVAA